MLKVLAFDYGASSGRGIIGGFNGSTLQLSEVHRFSSDPVLINGRFHWDVLRLFHEMKQGILKCVKNGDVDIRAIGVDTWGVDFGLLGTSGELLGNPFHYRDMRTLGMIEEADKIIPKREIYEQTGIAFQVFNTLYQLLAMKRENSPILENASSLLFMPNLFNYFLTGEKANEYTIASTSQMYDPKLGGWSKPILDMLGIKESLLGKVINPGTIVGSLTNEIMSELGIGKIPVVAVAGHDTGSAVVSVPVTEGKYAYISSGTWSLLGVESPVPVINDATYKLNYTNEGGFDNTIRLLKNIMGLWIYQECKRTWDKEGDSMSFDELEDAASVSEPFMSLIDPDSEEFFHPGSMPQKVADYCKRTGQKVPGTKPAIVRCVMESLALKYRMALEGLENIVGYKLPVVHIVGGGCKNVMLSQFTANASGKPVIAGPTEATAAGNLIAQLIALGEVKNLTEGRALIRDSFPTKVYEPMDTALWDDAYGRFVKLVK